MSWLYALVSRIPTLVAFALMALACGGAAAEVAPAPAVAEAAPLIDSTPPTSTPGGVVIPNIALTLADGSTFDFGQVDTPVMLVFWAEW